MLCIEQNCIKTSDIASPLQHPKNHYLCQVIDRAGRDQLWRGGLEKRGRGLGGFVKLDWFGTTLCHLSAHHSIHSCNNEVW